MATSTIKPKKGTTEQWAASERVLEVNEWGVEETEKGTYILRIGNGRDKFLDLKPVVDVGEMREIEETIKKIAETVRKDTLTTETVKETLLASGWTGDAAPYTQTITVNGLTEGVKARVFPAFSGDSAADLTLVEACAAVNNAKRVNGTITFSCLEDKPATDIPVNVELYHGAAATSGEDVPLLGFGSGDGMSMKLLWENASPTSEFGYTEMNLNINNGKRVGIYYYVNNLYQTMYREIEVGDTGLLDGVSGVTYYRTAEVTHSGVNFGNGYRYTEYGNWETVLENSACVPIKIYLINGAP